MSALTGPEALALLAEFQAAEAEVDRPGRELEQARQRRDEALGAMRRAGKQWEERR